MYTIYVTKENHKQKVKSYPFKAQCVAWLYLHGWIFSGIDDWSYKEVYVIAYPPCPSAKVEIVKEEDSRV